MQCLLWEWGRRWARKVQSFSILSALVNTSMLLLACLVLSLVRIPRRGAQALGSGAHAHQPSNREPSWLTGARSTRPVGSASPLTRWRSARPGQGAAPWRLPACGPPMERPRHLEFGMNWKKCRSAITVERALVGTLLGASGCCAVCT